MDCGIKTSVYTINSLYGKGTIISYYFDGLLINLINAKLKEDFLFISSNDSNSFNTLELSVLIDGEKIIRFSNLENDLIIEKSESYLLHDNGDDKIVFYRNKHINEVKIKMYDSFIKKHQMQTLFSSNKVSNLSTAQQLTSNMERIVNDMLTNSQKGLLKRLFLESKVLELIHLQLNIHSKKGNSSNENTLKKIYKVEAILQTNIHEQISIQQLARKVLLNQNVLKNEFKKLFGETIFNYTKNLRMHKAKNLLAYTQKPIYEIADMVGYKNPTHFTAAFKKFEKTTPKEFRKNYNYKP
ncbi:AraC family transcriptional regulator [Tenacibaculum sp. 1B UA]|uniref:helix-turn-helix domain-containing protein n=1 Tax=Tenacibaculum sp. 1B UA TaxID=2922252 RepID=UPI002A23E10D|nr:AraC family transcriptional regulator [Tenacibaculum sp. 1B UA]MDX8552439.1 AraC family transcriptional regulator [Tenacibaculum sp. 1B UA]